jgi:hypothetical protein
MSLVKVRYKGIPDLQRFLHNLSVARLFLTFNLTNLILHLESFVEISLLLYASIPNEIASWMGVWGVLYRPRWSSGQEITTSLIHATFIDHHRIKPTLLGRWGTLLGRQGGSQPTCTENRTGTGHLGPEPEPNRWNRALSTFTRENRAFSASWAGRSRRPSRSRTHTCSKTGSRANLRAPPVLPGQAASVSRPRRASARCPWPTSPRARAWPPVPSRGQLGPAWPAVSPSYAGSACCCMALLGVLTSAMTSTLLLIYKIHIFLFWALKIIYPFRLSRQVLRNGSLQFIIWDSFI